MANYCLVFDMLGFRSIVLNLPADRQTSRMDEWIKLVQLAMADHGVDSYNLISDTVFAVASPTAQGLQSLISVARQVLEHGACASFPIRGGISFGEVYWKSKIQHGKAIVQAYVLSENQDWMGVVCAPNLVHIDKCYGSGDLICYMPPMKSGLVGLANVVSWDVPMYEELIKAFVSGGLTKAHEHVGWSIIRKIENTHLFGIYRNFALESNTDPAHYYGLTRTFALDLLKKNSDELRRQLKGY